MRKVIVIIIVAVIIGLLCLGIYGGTLGNKGSFTILSNNDNSVFDAEIISFAKENKIDVEIKHADDLEAIDMLESNSSLYDAVWLSNSTWLYMLDGVKTLNSKSININPVVFGVKKSKANSLGFVNKEIYNKDIVDAIKSKKLSYVMSSVPKTNTGMVAYLGFLNALAGSPELLTSKMLEDEKLVDNLIDLFSGVRRVSGTDDFLRQMFLNSNEYEAVIATESALIEINKELEKSGKETLYLLYPVDGVAINDSPFAYIDNDQDRLDDFNKIQSFLLSKESQKKLEGYGKRTWYGGTNSNADSSSFRKDWGIDTTKYLIPLKYPSKDVMTEALALYLDEVRKPSATVFCLDFSGSMYGNGERDLKNAMEYILTYETAMKDKIQFSKKDHIYVIPFDDIVHSTLTTKNGRETVSLINEINRLSPGGQTNLYGCAEKAISILSDVSSDYTKAVILMTDGEANVGSYSSLEREYRIVVSKTNETIPIYSIMFASARESQLNDIARLTNAKVFDGRSNLTEAFKEVRSYN